MPTDSGENVYWVKQNDGVIVENCVPDAQNALLDLGKWFFEKTGKKLVCTAGTNGSHAGGEHSHANGYKLDLNDWYGPEGLGGEYFGYPLDSNGTQLLADFVSYGHSLGLGMSIEGDHVDVQTDGYEWTTNTSYGGYGNPNGNDVKMSPNNSGGGPRNRLDSPRSHGFKDTGSSVEITPSGKTYCEPVYPDYIYVTGNIPNSSIENTTMSSKEGLKAANGDTALMTGEMMQDLTGLKINAFTTDQAQAMAQKPFNPKDSILEFKVPSAGKPLNNNDPYPVDLKIEELENHMPRVKQYSLPYVQKHAAETKEMSKAILSLSDYTEKRLVKIENILATVMRYVFGIGSRMFINCQYYGGQDTGAKGVGKCIRCLRDDRCGDGQVMQLDQCLSCSRYEPIIGQRYDLLSEVGANLAAIQDDIQMGYMNMEDYIDWVRVEKMHKNRKDAGLNYQNTRTRKKDEKDFKDIWDNGVKMGWKLTPVEQQKAQINWRQDINSQDKSPQKLDSSQQSNGLGGSGLNPKSTITTGNSEKDAKDKQGDLDSTANGDKNGLDPQGNTSGDNSGSNPSGEGGSSGGASGSQEEGRNKLKEAGEKYREARIRGREYLAKVKQYHDKWEAAMDNDPDYHGGMTIPQYGKMKYPEDAAGYDEACSMTSQAGHDQEKYLNEMEEIKTKYSLSPMEGAEYLG